MGERDAANNLYQKAYGAWAGSSKGRAPDFTRCCEEISSRDRWALFYQCQRPRGHGPDGAYCKQHNPAAVEKRREASDTRSKEVWRARMFEAYGRTFYDALRKIADGHNDPRTLATEVLRRFEPPLPSDIVVRGR